LTKRLFWKRKYERMTKILTKYDEGGLLYQISNYKARVTRIVTLA
jgi:hypothetical protein